MKKIFQNKWIILLLILVPNFIITYLTTQTVFLYTLGAALGAATVVYLLYYACRALLSRTKLKREWVVPASIICGYAIYYAYLYLL